MEKQQQSRYGVIAGLRKQTTSSVSEVDEYLKTGFISDIPALSYWKGASDGYPALRELARHILGLPASVSLQGKYFGV